MKASTFSSKGFSVLRRLSVLLLFSIPVFASATTYYWNGVNSSQGWNYAPNWFPTGVPGPNDDAIIAPGANSLVLTSSVNVKSLNIVSDASMEITETGTLNINGSSDIGLFVLGELTNMGTINISNTTLHGVHVGAFPSNTSATYYEYGELNISNTPSAVAAIKVDGLLYIGSGSYSPTVNIDNAAGDGIFCFGGTVVIDGISFGSLPAQTEININIAGNVGIVNTGNFWLEDGAINIKNAS